MIKIENLFYSPVKSISFEESESLKVLTGRGIASDRIFAFVQNLDSTFIKHLIEDPKSRKLNNFVTLKNYPELNQYNFTYAKDKLILKKQDEIIITINPFFENEKILLCSETLKFNISRNFIRKITNAFFVY